MIDEQEMERLSDRELLISAGRDAGMTPDEIELMLAERGLNA